MFGFTENKSCDFSGQCKSRDHWIILCPSSLNFQYSDEIVKVFPGNRNCTGLILVVISFYIKRSSHPEVLY